MVLRRRALEERRRDGEAVVARWLCLVSAIGIEGLWGGRKPTSLGLVVPRGELDCDSEGAGRL